MNKIKKHILTFDVVYDYDLIGVCSHNSDYNLVWAINDHLNMRFARTEDYFYVTNKKGQASHFPYYYLCDEANGREFYLIKNKMEKNFLIAEKPQVDFFLFIKGNPLDNLDAFIAKLREIPAVLTTFSFDAEEFESTKNIIFD